MFLIIVDWMLKNLFSLCLWGSKSLDWTRFHCIVDVYHDTSISTIRLSTDKTCLSWSIFMRIFILFHKKRRKKERNPLRDYLQTTNKNLHQYLNMLFICLCLWLFFYVINSIMYKPNNENERKIKYNRFYMCSDKTKTHFEFFFCVSIKLMCFLGTCFGCVCVDSWQILKREKEIK